MLRWAILGTSFISETMATAISHSPGSTAVVVAGRHLDRLEDFRHRHGLARAYTSVAEAVSDPEVDVVYVGLPNHVHHEATILAAAAGRAIVSEKSLTVSMEQTDALLHAVDGKVFFVEGLMYLAHPLIARFVEVLSGGRLGPLRSISASYAADIATLVNPAGKGAIYNLGCYPASLTQLVVDTLEGDGAFGRPDVSAKALASTVDGNITDTVAALRFGSGALATLHTAETYGMASSFEVEGERGTLAFRTNPWLPHPGDNFFVWVGFDGSYEEFHVEDALDAFDHQVRMVEANIAAGRLEALRPSPRLADSRSVMQLLTDWEAAAVADAAR